MKHIYQARLPGEKQALKGVSFCVQKGKILGIIGATGSGKSTLVQHINGLLQPSSGKILLNGEDIWADKKKIRQVRFKVGLVFQNPEHQLFDSSVKSDISYGPRNMELSEEEIEKRVEFAARLCKVSEDLLEKSPFELSGGQKRRVAIAGVVAMQPEVLILDEPTAGLDPRGRDEIMENLAHLQQESGMTMIIVSHSMDEVAKYCDDIIVMSDGKIAINGPTREVYAQADKLHNLSLDVPEVAAIFKLLKDGGVKVGSVLTMDEAKDEIRRILSV